MYKKPMLEQFGTFRELTRQGSDSGIDIVGVLGQCNDNGKVGNPTACLPGGFTTS